MEMTSNMVLVITVCLQIVCPSLVLAHDLDNIDRAEVSAQPITGDDGSLDLGWMDNSNVQPRDGPAQEQPFPEHIRKLSAAIGFTDLRQLTSSYNHLEKYGYLTHVRRYLAERRNLHRLKKRQAGDDPQSTTDSIGRLFNWSLKFYQKFMALPVTGNLDQATISHMQRPRCGNRDLGIEYIHEKNYAGRRIKRYVLAGSRWKKRGVLDYCISQYPKRAITTNQTQAIDYELWKAFNIWAKYLPIPVKTVYCLDSSGQRVQKSKVDIRFAVREHGDGDPFDGPGGMLAHAYYPIFGGDLHFDEEERWSSSAIGTNLFVVALHEIGHVLGMDHSEHSSAIMAPVYPKLRPGLTLTNDDITGLSAIYEQ